MTYIHLKWHLVEKVTVYAEANADPIGWMHTWQSGDEVRHHYQPNPPLPPTDEEIADAYSFQALREHLIEQLPTKWVNQLW